MLSESVIRRLETRQEELAELFLDQSDTREWRDLSDAQHRGDAYWLKKNAAQTLGIMVRIQSLLNMHLQKPGGAQPVDPEEGEGTEKIALRAERDALAMIDRVRKKK